MTAPVLAHKKFYIIKPAEGTNQIKNPIFSPPDYEEDWSADGSGVTIEETGDEQRFGAYCMQVNTATGVASGAYESGLSVENGLNYTFSCYVKGTAGQAMRIQIRKAPSTVKEVETFTATGYWQRVQVTHAATETASDYVVIVIRDAVASTDPFYVDGVQFERYSSATTLMEGYMPGCRWEGYARNSSSIRSAQYRKGGEIVDLSDYCEIVQVTGLGHGDWNQILTKMTSGGDMYQTHTRKSRNFSIIVDFTGNSLSEIETNRKAVIDLIRPDLLTGQEMIVRYQGVDVNGDEATNPVDIVCVPLPATLVDTPDLPSYQRAVLNFTIPSGLLNGAYNDGAELDWIVDFPAERIVKRDPDGNWCKWGGAGYESLITGLNGTVYCMEEGPDGKIYVGGAFTDAGGVAAADNLARWNPITEAWEAVVAGINQSVRALAFDANGDLYVGGDFTLAGGITVNRIMKITKLTTSPTVDALGTGASDNTVYTIVIAPDGKVYVGGHFQTMNSVADTLNIAIWDGTSWSPLNKGLGPWGRDVLTIAFAPDGTLWAGGSFYNADGVNGDYICWWDGANFRPYWQPNSDSGTELNNNVMTIAFDHSGKLLIGGLFTNAGGIAAADYIARYNGGSWEALGSGTNGTVYKIFISAVYNAPRGEYITRETYVVGEFTTAGGLTLTDRIAIWSNGAWRPLDIDFPGSSSARSFLIASDGSLYIGGAFTSAGVSENAECGIVSDQVYEIGVASASANTYPFMQVRGPGTLKAITNYTTGKSVMFDGLTLQPGEWINLFFDPLNLIFQGGWSGRGNLMRYVVPGSDYGDFYLMPGSNLLSLFMTGSTTDSGAFMSWTPLFWGLDGALL